MQGSRGRKILGATKCGLWEIFFLLCFLRFLRFLCSGEGFKNNLAAFPSVISFIKPVCWLVSIFPFMPIYSVTLVAIIWQIRE